MAKEREYMDFAQDFGRELANMLDVIPQQICLKPDGIIYAKKEYGDGLSQIMKVDCESLYSKFRDGTGIKELSEAVMHKRNCKCTDQSMKWLKCLSDYEEIRPRLFIKAMNFENNLEGLKDAVYEKTGDIALAVYIILQYNSYGFSAIKLKTPILKLWTLSKAQVVRDAFANTYQINPPRLYEYGCKTQYMDSKTGDFMNPDGHVKLKEGYEGNYLTNINKREGGLAVFYPGVCEKLAYLFQDDFYVVFTSIHEAILHNKKGIRDEQDLKRALGKVNEGNRSGDILSNCIFLYRKEEKCLKAL